MAASEEKAKALSAELNKLKSRQMACSAFQKGECKKGDECIFAHVDKDNAEEFKRANKAWNAQQRAKSPAGDNKKDGK